MYLHLHIAQFGLATFQVLSSHMWLMAAMLDKKVLDLLLDPLIHTLVCTCSCWYQSTKLL